jgi:acyl carrier protein
LLTAAMVREIILTRWPGRFAPELLGENVPLGDDGLDLDSIEVVEVVVACEDLLGVEALDEQLVRQEPLTISGMVAHFNAA